MSLRPAEQHVLDAIEDGLARADPQLAGLLTTFTRLAAGEEMPAREAIQPARRRRPGGGQRRAGKTPRPGAWRHLAMVLWLTTAVALIAVAVVLGGKRGKGDACSRLPAVACIWQAPGHAVGAAARSLSVQG